MSSTYTYRLGQTTYINLTNRCTNDCEFCVRHTGPGVGGYDLRLEAEPSSEQVIEELQKERPDSVVFCGFGEPTIPLETLLQVASFVKSYGGRTRLNTNGQANLFHGRDVTADLAACIDDVSISLNAPDAVSYARITRCLYGEQGFASLTDFAEKCRQRGIRTTLSVVDVLSNDELEKCRQIARETGASFRVRPYVD